MSDEIMDTADGNAQWADSVSKILKSGKSSTKKTLVLSRAKKLTDRKKNDAGVDTKPDFEIVTGDGDSKTAIKNDAADLKSKHKNRKKKKPKILPDGIRRKPTVLDQNHNRMCRKIAEKGAVEFANCVAAAQKKIREQREARRKGCSSGSNATQLTSGIDQKPDYGKQLFSEMLMSASGGGPSKNNGSKTNTKKASKDDEEVRNWQEERI